MQMHIIILQVQQKLKLDDKNSSLSDVSQASLVVPSANDSASTSNGHAVVPKRKKQKNTDQGNNIKL